MLLFRVAVDNPAVGAALAACAASAHASRETSFPREYMKGIPLCGDAGLDSCCRNVVLDWELETRHLLHGYVVAMQQTAPRAEFNVPR